jgi:hypothetical protein
MVSDEQPPAMQPAKSPQHLESVNPNRHEQALEQMNVPDTSH